MYSLIQERLDESIIVKNELRNNKEVLLLVSRLADEIVKCLYRGCKLVLCGNGGSASDALHFAGEIVGRFQKERNAWPAMVLNADVATMTAIANDYGYGEIFARQVQAYVQRGDIFIGLSTGGNSENVYRAVEEAKKKGVLTAAFLGKDGGRIGKLVEYPLIVPCTVTARVQECHITLIHTICEIVEMRMNEGGEI